MKYSIVIPTYNHLENHLKPCLRSIAKNTILSDIEVIVVANGCTDGTKEYVNSLGGPFKLFNFKDPLGYTKATNIGIQQCNGENIVLLNNDTEILDFQDKSEWLRMLESPISNGGISGVTNAELGETVPEEGKIGGWFTVFFCAMASAKMFEDVGLLDEDFSPGVGEDVDLCLRARKKGYRPVTVPVDAPFNYHTTFPIYHKNSGTFRFIEGSEENYRRGMERLKARFSAGYYD
jgi:GT2 family glycosyltransferase